MNLLFVQYFLYFFQENEVSYAASAETLAPVVKRAIPVIPAVALKIISRISKTRLGNHH